MLLQEAVQLTQQQVQTEKALESAVSFSQSLSQWAYIVLGGSVALLVRNLKLRPRGALMRHSFWLFVPGWVLLFWSIYEGIQVQGARIAYLMSPNPQRTSTILSFNLHTHWQIQLMEWGLGVFAIWLLVFLIVWILHPTQAPFVERFDEL
jgi:hypothetical protein